MVSIMCLRGVGLFSTTKSKPARWAISRKRMGERVGEDFRVALFRANREKRKALAPARKLRRENIKKDSRDLDARRARCTIQYCAQPFARGSTTTEDQAIKALHHVTEIGFVAPLKFRDRAARITNVGKGLPHRGPVHVSVSQIDPRIAVFLA